MGKKSDPIIKGGGARSNPVPKPSGGSGTRLVQTPPPQPPKK